MRELFDIHPSDPIESARRGARPALRGRFYESATVVATPHGHAIRLDGKLVNTPSRRVLAAPTMALAQALAAEWNAQTNVIDTASMPLTRLANAIIDGVADAPQPVADEIGKYLASDLLFYRAASPRGLVELQAQHWDPVLIWACDALGVHFEVGEGVVHIAQPDEALKAVEAVIPKDPWQLGALHVATTLTGSALIAIAILLGSLTADMAWQAAHVDEDWNMAQWGRDEMAMARRAFRFAEFSAAAMVLKSLAN